MLAIIEEASKKAFSSTYFRTHNSIYNDTAFAKIAISLLCLNSKLDSRPW